VKLEVDVKEEKRKTRHAAISVAAYHLLETKGYNGASMLSIAKAAHASNETLYLWYGDKKGLFEQLVKDNAAETKQMLETALLGQDDALETLTVVAVVFLTMLLGDKAILLNRAAAADPSGELGAVISVGGRDAVQPLFETLMQRLAQGHEASAKQLTGWFLGALIGDLQIRRIIGVEKAPCETEIKKRVTTALSALSKLRS